MHDSVKSWLFEVAVRYDLDTGREQVLEVGSRNINGTARVAFRSVGRYVGLDMVAGPDVDVVAPGHRIPFPDNEFTLVVCCEMLEHDAQPWRTLPEIARVLKPAGHLVLTTRGPGFPFHEYPGDYYRYTADGLSQLVEAVGKLDIRELRNDPQPGHPGFFLVATKPYP